ncbi:TonB-dependent receptor plug domain-containing protein [Flavitalea flava]
MSKKLMAMLMLSAAGTSGLMAQTGTKIKKDSTVKELDQVIVTATKSPVKQNETGKVVTIITKEELEKSTAKTLGQILNEQAGITVGGALNNTGSVQSIYMRGAASGRTLITIDGVPVNDPSTPGNEFDINLIAPDNIERIEILKGAQSTLYGSDAIAGVINIITTGDIKKPFNVRASLAGGNYGTYKGNLQVFGKANQFTYSIKYTRLRTDGFSAAYDSSKKGNFDRDDYSGNAVTTNLAWTPTAELTVKGFAQYSRYKTGIDAGSFADAKNYDVTSKNWLLGGGFVYKLPNVTLNGNYRYGTVKRTSLEDSVFGQPYYMDKFQGITQFTELFANTSLGNGFTLLTGADYRYASMNDTSVSISSFGTYPGNFKDTSLSQTSMYGSLFFNSHFGLNVELGGRLNTHSRYGSNYTYTFNPSFLLRRSVKIYGSIATGYKAPSLYQLYSSYGSPDLQPETSLNYEGGIQYSNAILNSRATYYYRKIKNGLDFDYTTYTYFNASRQKAQGIELENRVQLTRQLSLTANYTWLKSSEEIQNRIDYKDTTYQYSLRRPKHTINATLGLQATRQLFISVSGHYESKRHDVGGYQVADVPLDSYFILNGYAEFQPVKKLKFFADAKNITNKKFFTIFGYNSIPFMITGGATLDL